AADAAPQAPARGASSCPRRAYVYCAPRRAPVAQAAGDGGPIAGPLESDPAGANGPAWSKRSLWQREPVSSPRRRAKQMRRSARTNTLLCMLGATACVGAPASGALAETGGASAAPVTPAAPTPAHGA